MSLPELGLLGNVSSIPVDSADSLYSLQRLSISTTSLPTEFDSTSNSSFPFPSPTAPSPTFSEPAIEFNKLTRTSRNARNDLIRSRRISLPAVIQVNSTNFGVYGINGKNRMSVASLGSIESLPEEELEENDLEFREKSIREGSGRRREGSDSSSLSGRSRKPSLLHRVTSPAQLINITIPNSNPRARANQRYQSFAIPKGTSVINSRSPLSRPTSFVGIPVEEEFEKRERSNSLGKMSEEELIKREDRRWRIAIELRDSERVYLGALEEIDREYYQPLLAALPISPLTSKRASRSSLPTSPILSPLSLPSSPIIGPLRRMSTYLPTSPLASPLEFTGQIIPRREILEIFSNFEDVLNLARIMSSTLDSVVTDKPSDPVAVVELPSTSGHAPELSSSGETIDSVGPSTPTESAIPSLLREEKKQKGKGKEEAPPIRVGKALLKILPFLKSYSFFISNFSTALTRISSLESSSPTSSAVVFGSSSIESQLKWEKFVQERKQRGVGKGISLSGLLLNVVQRIPRYRLLLGELCRFTEETHGDFKDLREAFKVVEKASFLEGEIRAHLNSLETLELQRVMTGLEEVLVIPGRIFLKKGNLIKLDRRGVVQARVFFLFNDLLLYAVEEGSWNLGLGFSEGEKVGNRNGLSAGGVAGGSGGSGTMRFCKRLGLYDITVVGVEDGTDLRKFGFQILTSEKSFSVYAGSFEEKQDWIDAIRDAKSNLLRDRRTLLKDGDSTMRRVRRERQKSILVSPSALRPLSTPFTSPNPNFGFIPPTPSEEIEDLILDGPILDPLTNSIDSFSSLQSLESSIPSLKKSISQPSLQSRRWSDLTPPTAPQFTEDFVPSLPLQQELKVMEEYFAPIFIPDSKVEKCMRCAGGFGFWRRRHHCRLCGAVVCGTCSTKTFIIPAGKEGLLDRVARSCDACYSTVFENSTNLDLDLENSLIIPPFTPSPSEQTSSSSTPGLSNSDGGWRRNISARDALGLLLGRGRGA